MELNNLKTDETAEKDGVWEDLGQGARIRIARVGNPRYDQRLQALLKPHRRAVRAGNLDDGIMNEILIKVIAETVLLDWEGLKMDGKAVKYSRENAIKILTEFKEFRNLVSDAAQDASLFKAQEREDGEGN